VPKLALLVILAMCACSSTNSRGSAEAAQPTQSDPVRAATLAELIGPWRREPMRPPVAVIAAADRTCRLSAVFPRDVVLVAIDARGGSRLPAVFAGDDAVVDCLPLTISDNGVVEGSENASETGPQPVAGPGHLIAQGGTGSGQTSDPGDAWCSATGRAGPGVTRVVIEAQVAGSIAATVQNGWYLAWWPVSCRRAAPLVITAYDAAGTGTFRIRQCWIEATFFTCPD